MKHMLTYDLLIALLYVEGLGAGGEGDDRG